MSRRKSPQKMAEEHWAWLESLLQVLFTGTATPAEPNYAVLHKIYVDAFVHGMKHGMKHGR